MTRKEETYHERHARLMAMGCMYIILFAALVTGACMAVTWWYGW